jgi:Ca2+-binding RTX toxin-like protein
MHGGLDADEMIGGPGNDVLQGGDSDDLLDGADGNDDLIGNTGQDTLKGGTGADVLNGAAGADVLEGGAGADRFRFHLLDGELDEIADFQLGVGGDVLAIGDLLTGFAPGNEADFVQLFDNGTDTTVSVDPNGATGGSGFTQVALLGGVTGSSLGSLVADGNLDLATS